MITMQNYVSKFLGAAVVLGLLVAGCSGAKKYDAAIFDTTMANKKLRGLPIREITIYHEEQPDTSFWFRTDIDKIDSAYLTGIGGTPGRVELTPETRERAELACKTLDDNNGKPVLYKGGQRVD
jgi:hypothetical protein